MKAPDLVVATSQALTSLDQDRGRSMARGEDWTERLRRELLNAFVESYGVDRRMAEASVEEELAAADDPVGLLEELVLRHRLAIAMYDGEIIRTALADA